MSARNIDRAYSVSIANLAVGQQHVTTTTGGESLTGAAKAGLESVAWDRLDCDRPFCQIVSAAAWCRACGGMGTIPIARSRSHARQTCPVCHGRNTTMDCTAEMVAFLGSPEGLEMASRAYRHVVGEIAYRELIRAEHTA